MFPLGDEKATIPLRFSIRGEAPGLDVDDDGDGEAIADWRVASFVSVQPATATLIKQAHRTPTGSGRIPRGRMARGTMV